MRTEDVTVGGVLLRCDRSGFSVAVLESSSTSNDTDFLDFAVDASCADDADESGGSGCDELFSDGVILSSSSIRARRRNLSSKDGFNEDISSSRSC